MKGADEGNPIMRIRGLTKSFPGRSRPAVDSVSLDIHRGEIVGLVGLNGAGKTSLIRVCAGVSLPSSGQVVIDGRNVVSEKAEASRHVGWVPEFPTFEPGASALDQLLYYAGFYGLSGREAREQCFALMKQVGLKGSESKKLRTFSQGMKKRYALAAALLGDPDVILLDEILNGLDPEGVLTVRNMLMGLRDQGRAVLLSSHILGEVEQISDLVVILHRGRLIKSITRDDLGKVAGEILRVTIANLDENAITYLRDIGSYLEQEGTTLWISDPTEDAGVVNHELVKRGYIVTTLAYESESLESQFFAIIAEAGEKEKR